MRKIPFAGVELTSQRVRGLRGTSELPGRPDTFMRRASHHARSLARLGLPEFETFSTIGEVSTCRTCIAIVGVNPGHMSRSSRTACMP